MKHTQIHHLTCSQHELETQFYPKIRNSVFHFTSERKLSQILETEEIFPSGSNKNLITTSIHSEESMGAALHAVCLFDLRNKSDEQIAPGKSYYDFLKGKQGETLVYLILDDRFLHEVITLDQVEISLKNTKMYLPEIESWYPNSLPLNKLKCIYTVKTQSN